MSIRIGARVCGQEGEVGSLAYLWRETPIQAPVILLSFCFANCDRITLGQVWEAPILTFNNILYSLCFVIGFAQVWGAPIYGDDLHRLPSPPGFWEDAGAV